MFSTFVTMFGTAQDLPKFLNRSEKRFVQNVIDIQGSKPVEITKRKDLHIVIEFSNIMYVLKPDGYVGEMWILENEDWVSLGREY